MESIFENEFEAQSQNEQLSKGLEAGYDTNEADYIIRLI